MNNNTLAHRGNEGDIYLPTVSKEASVGIKTAGEFLGCKDLDILDDYMTDDELLDHRDEILYRMRLAVEAVEQAAVNIMTELYFEACAPYRKDNRFPKDFDLRTCDYHNFLSDALINLKRKGFFVEEAEDDE